MWSIALGCFHFPVASFLLLMLGWVIRESKTAFCFSFSIPTCCKIVHTVRSCLLVGSLASYHLCYRGSLASYLDYATTDVYNLYQWTKQWFSMWALMHPKWAQENVKWAKSFLFEMFYVRTACVLWTWNWNFLCWCGPEIFFGTKIGHQGLKKKRLRATGLNSAPGWRDILY